MNPNDPMAQMQRQQEQMRRQQEEMRRQMAWQAEQDKKRKRSHRQADMLKTDKLQSGGVNIFDSDYLRVGGDITGRDKVTQIEANYLRDEVSGFTLFVSRVFAFIFTLLVAGAIFGIIGAVISAGTGNSIPLIIAEGLALLTAFVNASSISRYRD